MLSINLNSLNYVKLIKLIHCVRSFGAQITTENCLSFLLYADTFSSTPLYQQALSIAAKDFEVIRLSPEFLDLPFEHVNKLLSIDTMEVEYEEYVFESFKSWLSHDITARSVN